MGAVACAALSSMSSESTVSNRQNPRHGVGGGKLQEGSQGSFHREQEPESSRPDAPHIRIMNRTDSGTAGRLLARRTLGSDRKTLAERSLPGETQAHSQHTTDGASSPTSFGYGFNVSGESSLKLSAVSAGNVISRLPVAAPIVPAETPANAPIAAPLPPPAKPPIAAPAPAPPAIIPAVRLPFPVEV